MKTVSDELKTHLAGENQTTADCWLTIQTDGTVQGFTSHDGDLTFDLESWLGDVSLAVPAGVLSTGSVVYAASSGYTPTDVATKSNLAVDDLEMQGILSSPSITEDDLRAGLWDFATIIHFLVNYADLTMGAMILRCGTLGEVTIERDSFKAELRGLMQPYTRQLGELTSPSCRANLGDDRCKFSLAGTTVGGTNATVTGTITAVNPDLVTLYDTGRTEPGPTGGIAITHVSNANPGQITVSDGSTLSNGEAIAISGIVGPDLLNQVTIVRNLSGNTFDLGIDTSDTATYPAYVSGGTVTPLGSDSGYFDHGVMTMTSGLNNTFEREIKAYALGQFVLWQPFPYDVEIGDTYSAVTGCDKSVTTCKAKFANVVNFQGEPYLPGIDKITQVGKHQ